MSFRGLYHPRRQAAALLCNTSLSAAVPSASRGARRRTGWSRLRAAQQSTQVREQTSSSARLTEEPADPDGGSLDAARFPAGAFQENNPVAPCFASHHHLSNNVAIGRK